MTSSLLYDPGSRPNRRRGRVFLFVLWALVAGYLAWNHAVWRDEVRALSFALGGSNVFAMLRGLHGEGHPALWYLLLRSAHGVLATPKVMQIVAYLVAFSALLLFSLRSPFRLLVLGLVLMGRFAIFEYTVMARNYGISMLLLFLLAYFYPRHRERGVLLGALLLLLANCNAHSVLLVDAFLVFWLVDILLGNREGRAAAVKIYLLNFAIALVGIVLCAATILPTINDAAQVTRPTGAHLVAAAISALLLPSLSFDFLMLTPTLVHLMSKLHLLHGPYLPIAKILQSVLLFGSTLGLIRRPAALVGAWTALAGFVLFFTVIYPGPFRHQALWLVFMLAMYWIAGQSDGAQAQLGEAPEKGKWHGRRAQQIGKAGSIMFLVLLLLQAADGVRVAAALLSHRAPESRIRDLAATIAARPELHDAIVIADPDFLVEALPYYVSNQTYLMREKRFGDIVIFTRKARLQLTLSDVLDEARTLHTETGKPVIVLLQHETDISTYAASSATVPIVFDEGYDWKFSITPAQARTFLASTKLIEKFGPVFGDSAETFDAYLLR